MQPKAILSSFLTSIFGRQAPVPPTSVLSPSQEKEFSGNTDIPEEVICDLAVEALSIERADIVNTGYRRFLLCYAAPKLNDSYKIDFESKTLRDGDMECELNNRGTGRLMYAYRMVVGLALGMESIHNRSGKEMGGYTWARAGMYVEHAYKNSLEVDLRKRLRTLRDVLPEDVYDRADDLCALNDVSDLQKIANLSFKIDDPQFLFDNFQCDFTFETYKEKKFFKENSLTLGQMLLLGMEYAVYANFHDPVQMEKIEDYSGVKIRERAAEFLQTHTACINQPKQFAARSLTPVSQTAHPR